MDWGDDRSLLNACENIDVIVHAAGLNAKDCLENPDLALKVNGIATERLVRAASKQLVSKFIYISSAHVYTDNLSGVIEASNITTRTPMQQVTLPESKRRRTAIAILQCKQ